MREMEVDENGWVTERCLKSLFKSVGKDVKVSPHAFFYGAHNIEIGDNVRIDHGNLFLCANGYMRIGSHVHLAANSIFSAGGGIVIEDHVQVGFNTKFVSASDDISGDNLIGPTYGFGRKITALPIQIGKLGVVLMGSYVIPGTIFGEAAVLAPLSGTRQGQILPAWTISGGVPCKPLKARTTNCLNKVELWEQKYAEQAEKEG